MAEQLCTKSISVACFDFAGCGQSEGEYITLGLKEKNDVRLVLQYIRKNFNQRNFVLYGRSMGAVAIIIYIHENKSEVKRVKGLILDSPFSDLECLCKYHAKKNLILDFVFKWGLNAVNQITKQKAGLDIYKIKPIELV